MIFFALGNSGATLQRQEKAWLGAHTDPAAINVYGNRDTRECRTWFVK